MQLACFITLGGQTPLSSMCRLLLCTELSHYVQSRLGSGKSPSRVSPADRKTPQTMRSLFSVFCHHNLKFALWHIDYKTCGNLVRLYNLDVYAAYFYVAFLLLTFLHREP